ncbi:SDR family NAD(P)-dependent oxidoreductase [Anatilimnocola aggregata]|nr:SDR family NAD(P)-dependent oxidoreductase [Anatilimnocola aggregata]
MTKADQPTDQVVLITGASSGIGRATAIHLATAGYRVFGTSRHPADAPPGIEMIQLEVTCNDSVAACLAEVYSQTAGRLDVLVNNVGTGILAATEECSIEQVQKLFDINLFGAIRMTNAVLPSMRDQHGGRVLFLSSAGGVVSVPYAGYYCATKHALEAYVESLRLEVEEFGIQAALIAPGTVSTDAGDKAIKPDRPLDAYSSKRASSAEQFVQAIRDGMPPEHVADAILHAIRDERIMPRYPVGMQSWGISLMKALLPQRILESGIRRTTISSP